MHFPSLFISLLLAANLSPVSAKPVTTTATQASIKSTSLSAEATIMNVATTPTPIKRGSSDAILGVAIKPSDWPTATQAGPAPTSTVASASDPFLLELSKAYNNTNNPLYTQVHTGNMTFYEMGITACGDEYDDNSFTAAVSQFMYDIWPGAPSTDTTRNPICGPYVPGRIGISSSGSFITVVPGFSSVIVGGNGLLSCDVSSQCHIPLTATVKHGDNEIIVSIVDRCTACQEGDIDLTPIAFGALADPNIGRTSVTWWFNQF